MKNPQNYIKTKVIEAYVIFDNPKKLMHVIQAADSIDTVVLDLQELNPEQNIKRESVIKWKFLTVEDCKKMGLVTKGRYLLPNSEQKFERSVATEAK